MCNENWRGFGFFEGVVVGKVAISKEIKMAALTESNELCSIYRHEVNPAFSTDKV